MLKVVPFITTWLGLLCIWTTWLGSSLSSSHPLNGMIQWLIHSFAWDALPTHPEASTRLFPYHLHQIHQRWCQMEAFHHIWLWILNQIYVLSRWIATLKISRFVTKQATFQVQTPQPEIRFPMKSIPPPYLREQQQVRTILDLLPESQCRFLFGQNNVPLRLKTHNQRKSKNQRRVRNLLLVLCLFPPSQKSHVRALPRTTRMMMQHPKPHLHMTTQLSTLVKMPQYHPPPPPPHHQALPRHWSSHQIPPFASSNLQKLLDLPPTPHSDPGRTLMIKSWSISRMTPNLVPRGRRSALDFVVILRYASWDGEF